MNNFESGVCTLHIVLCKAHLFTNCSHTWIRRVKHVFIIYCAILKSRSRPLGYCEVAMQGQDGQTEDGDMGGLMRHTVVSESCLHYAARGNSRLCS